MSSESGFTPALYDQGQLLARPRMMQHLSSQEYSRCSLSHTHTAHNLHVNCLH